MATVKNISLKLLFTLLIFIGVVRVFSTNSHAETTTIVAPTYTSQAINVNKNNRPTQQTKSVENVVEESTLEVIAEDRSDQITVDIQQPNPPPIEEIIKPEILTEDMPQQLISDDSYILGAEDKIKVAVYGEKDLSSDYKIGGDGAIAMPLIGTIVLQDLTLRAAERLIEARYKEGYLKNPSVSIEVQESRPFYIMGEVRRPGSYNYINGMNVLQAVAISGGFTYRANQKQVDVIRGARSPSKPQPLKPEDMVRAGDIIFVRERFF